MGLSSLLCLTAATAVKGTMLSLVMAPWRLSLIKMSELSVERAAGVVEPVYPIVGVELPESPPPPQATIEQHTKIDIPMVFHNLSIPLDDKKSIVLITTPIVFNHEMKILIDKVSSLYARF